MPIIAWLFRIFAAALTLPMAGSALLAGHALSALFTVAILVAVCAAADDGSGGDNGKRNT